MICVALLLPSVLISVYVLTMEVGRSHEEVANLEEEEVCVYLERARCVHHATWVGFICTGALFQS